MHQVAGTVESILVVVQLGHLGHHSVEVHHVVSAHLHGVHTVNGELLRRIGRSGIGGTVVEDGGIPQVELVGTLDGAQGLRSVARVVVHSTVVVHMDAVMHIAALHRGTGTNDGVGDIHHGQGAGGRT